MDITIDVTERDSASVLAVAGEVDLQSAPHLANALEEARVAGASIVVVDLSRVDFLDSSGLGVLVTANRDIQADGASLRIVRPRPAINKVLTLTRLTEVIATFDSVDEALA